MVKLTPMSVMQLAISLSDYEHRSAIAIFLIGRTELTSVIQASSSCGLLRWLEDAVCAVLIRGLNDIFSVKRDVGFAIEV